MTPQEEIEILQDKKDFKELSLPILFLEGLLYSLLSFALVMILFYVFQKIFPPKFLLKTEQVVLLKWSAVVLISSLVFSLSKIGNSKVAWQVFVRTLLVGVVCSVIILISFLALFRFMISLDDIIVGIVKIYNWRVGSAHFKEILIAFAAVFLMAYPLLFVSVKYTLHRMFWTNEDELLLPD